jgi:hypothetical protein
MSALIDCLFGLWPFEFEPMASNGIDVTVGAIDAHEAFTQAADERIERFIADARGVSVNKHARGS